MLSKYDLVIFDWDGTLMDSVGRIVSSMKGVAKELALHNPSDIDVKDIIGLSLNEAAERLFPDACEHTKNKIKLAYKKHYIELDKTPTPLFNYAHETLSALKVSGKSLSIATGKGREGLNRVMAETDAEQYFVATRSADDCASKPSPEMIQTLLDELNILPEKAVMIGDSALDMKMAKSAGIDRIGVSYGAHSIEKLNLYSPIAIIDCLSELKP